MTTSKNCCYIPKGKTKPCGKPASWVAKITVTHEDGSSQLLMLYYCDKHIDHVQVSKQELN